MRTLLLVIGIVLMTAMTMGLGCNPDQGLTDISGWDLSACWNGWQTCGALFLDNYSHIQGGEQAVLNAMSPFNK
jgi:hypothetical protein